MTGTFINVTAIIVGGLLGIFFGARLSDNLKNTVVAGIGFLTTAIGDGMMRHETGPGRGQRHAGQPQIQIAGEVGDEPGREHRKGDLVWDAPGAQVIHCR